MMAINTFTVEQITQLDQELDSRLVSVRKGGNYSVRYIEGHDAIDQANRLFGYGGWSYRPLFCEQKTILDPLTGEAVGVAYKTQVELQVQGCNPIVEVGSQPVASWNVRDTVMGKRKKGDMSDIKDWEVITARRTIVESHEMAEKGAVTDALKRALRTFGNQFGNGLYGDGRVDLTPVISDAPTETMIRDVRIYAGKVYSFKDENFDARWQAFKSYVLGKTKSDLDLSMADITKIRTTAETAQKEAKAKQSATNGAGGGR